MGKTLPGTTITAKQLSALRALRERGEQPHHKTGAKFVQWGFARQSKEGGFFMTPSGVRWIDNYVEQTGDGPEDLKAMFRF